MFDQSGKISNPIVNVMIGVAGKDQVYRLRKLGIVRFCRHHYDRVCSFFFCSLFECLIDRAVNIDGIDFASWADRVGEP